MALRPASRRSALFGGRPTGNPITDAECRRRLEKIAPRVVDRVHGWGKPWGCARWDLSPWAGVEGNDNPHAVDKQHFAPGCRGPAGEHGEEAAPLADWTPQQRKKKAAALPSGISPRKRGGSLL